MSDRSLGWKYWDHVGNCWQYIDLDEFYSQEEITRDQYHRPQVCEKEESSTGADWPNLTIVDLLDSEHLKRPKSKSSRLLPSPAFSEHQISKAKSTTGVKGSRPTTRSRGSRLDELKYGDEEHESEAVNNKYDMRSISSRLTNAKSTILDNPVALAKLTKSNRDRSSEKNWESSLRTPNSPNRDHFISSSKSAQYGLCHHRQSYVDIGKINQEDSSKVKLVWNPRPVEGVQSEVEKRVANRNADLSSVSLVDHFHPTGSGIIHSPSPISQRILHATKPRNTVGYTVEPITGTGVRPPAELENFKCEPIMDGAIQRPDTPVEIKRLRLLPAPVVRKCMAEALRNGILEPEDTDLIMKRIKNKSTGPNSESDEENIKNQSKRLISPLKYVRRPRQDGGPIYKLDDSKSIHSNGKTNKQTEPITFKVLSKQDSAIIPTHLEIPFLQKNINQRRIRTKSWQSTLRSSALPPRKTPKKPIISFDIHDNVVESNLVGVVTRPLPPPPSPIKHLFSAVPDLARYKEL